MATTSSAPSPAPLCFSPKAAMLASLSTYTGQSTNCSKISRTLTFSGQYKFTAPFTVPFSKSTGPGTPIPTPSTFEKL
ncbi:Uncharacterised protein [Staphylococcus aureus]|nr:Uncharacterised protein [Staphylococcus aureus]SCU48190.1 Uncharacterised protein [Staphylococcus aureus]